MTEPGPADRLAEVAGLEPALAIEGELAERYRAAVRLLGIELEGDRFEIDGAGVCPQLEAALHRARPPLPAGAAVWILLDERQAGILRRCERISFEAEALEALFRDGRRFLRAVTRQGALVCIVRLLPGMPRSLEELSTVEGLQIELRSEGGKLEKFEELDRLDRALEKPENHLSREYVQRMVDLVRELSAGGSELRDLRMPELPSGSGAFCVPALGSVYYLPGEDQDLLIYPPPYPKPDLSETYQGLATPVKLSSPGLMRLLEKLGWLRFDPALIQQRLEEIEDEVLLAAGIDPFGLSAEQRRPALATYRQSLPRTWHELSALHLFVERSRGSFETNLDTVSEETRVKLAVPRRDGPLVSRLLSDLDHIDYLRFHAVNRLRFAQHFRDYSELKKRFVWNCICRPRPSVEEIVLEEEPEDGQTSGPGDDDVPEITFL